MGACGSKGGVNEKGSTAQILDNESTLSDIRSFIEDKLHNESETSTQKSVSSQNVTIDYTVDPEVYYSPMFNTQARLRWPWGTVRKDCGPNYGCVYDITQVNEINVSSFKQTDEHYSEDIWTNIKMKLKKNAKLQMTGNNEGLTILNNAIDQSDEEVVEKITDILTKMSQQDFDDEQNIIIKSNTPVRCPDPCGDRGNPKITQHALIELKSSDIVNSALFIVHKHASDMGLDSKLKAEDTDSACMVQMILSCVFCIVCAIIIYMVFGDAAKAKAGKGTQSDNRNDFMGKIMESVPPGLSA